MVDYSKDLLDGWAFQLSTCSEVGLSFKSSLNSLNLVEGSIFSLLVCSWIFIVSFNSVLDKTILLYSLFSIGEKLFKIFSSELFWEL